MKYCIDCEFLEGTQKEKFPISLFRKNTPPTIDLISIGIVAEDGREYYAISKDFNLEEAWNRHEFKLDESTGISWFKVYWLRENVLYPIFAELFEKHNPEIWNEEFGNLGNFMGYFERHGNGEKCFKELLKIYGKSNKDIAREINLFCHSDYHRVKSKSSIINGVVQYPFSRNPEFYAYYANYDWVAFCWLFGKMMDLPSNFPMYCKDLKQMLDEKAVSIPVAFNLEYGLTAMKTHPDYPKQENEHNALDDARWGQKLFNFLQNL